MKIIDVSKHNGSIDWGKVKKSGIDGVIIRAGYGREITQKDFRFEQNYINAKKVGLHIGAYWYSYADSPADAVTEAKVFLETVKNKTFDLPLYFDIEESKHVKMSKSECTAITVNFCNTLEKAGYYAGVYSFDSFFTSNLDLSVQNRFTCWVARVENVKPKCCKKYDMHQYSWVAKIDGISGVVDINDCYKDFPTIIKKAGLNGYQDVPTVCTVTAVATGVSVTKANVIKAACEQMGMSVEIK